MITRPKSGVDSWSDEHHKENLRFPLSPFLSSKYRDSEGKPELVITLL